MPTYTLPDFKTVTCTKGSTYHGLTKNREYPVVKAEVKDDYTVAITLQFQDGNKTFYARHPNRLSDFDFPVHQGDPTKKARFRIDEFRKFKFFD